MTAIKFPLIWYQFQYRLSLNIFNELQINQVRIRVLFTTRQERPPGLYGARSVHCVVLFIHDQSSGGSSLQSHIHLTHGPCYDSPGPVPWLNSFKFCRHVFHGPLSVTYNFNVQITYLCQSMHRFVHFSPSELPIFRPYASIFLLSLILQTSNKVLYIGQELPFPWHFISISQKLLIHDRPRAILRISCHLKPFLKH